MSLLLDEIALATARLAEALCFLGFGRLPVGRPADRAPSEANFPGNPLTSDLPRYLRSVDVLRERRDLLVTAPTLRWSASALRAMGIATSDSFPSTVVTPVLMLAAALPAPLLARHDRQQRVFSLLTSFPDAFPRVDFLRPGSGLGS